MAKYSDIKGFTVQTLSTDTVASAISAGSFSSGGDLNSARRGGNGAGVSLTATIAYGGYTTTNSANTESYNGTSWTEVNDLNTARNQATQQGQGGTSTSALYGTQSGGTNVESWDGSSWSEISEFNTARYAHGMGGTSNTASVVFGGEVPGAAFSALTETWNGSSWTETSDLSTARNSGSAVGISTAAIYVGGQIPPNAAGNQVESWNGSSWSELSEIGYNVRNAGQFGTYTEAVIAGGLTPPYLATVQYWDGSSWTEIADIATARSSTMCGGASTAGLISGGTTGSNSAATEEWSAPAVFNQIQEGQLYFNSTTNTFKETLFVISDGTWASGGSLNDGRSSFTGIGIQTAVVAASGQDGSTSLIDSVEEYNGTVWTEVNDTPVTLKYPGAGGVLTAGWLAGGLSAWNGATFNAETYEYDGTNWTDSGNINTSRYTAYGGGPQTAAFIAGGNNTSFAAVDDTELYDGSSWTEVADLNTARANGFGNGTQTDGIFAGGSPGTKTEAETWDGTSWTEVSELNTGRYSIGVGGGTAPGSSVLAAGGAKDPGNVNNVESWNGTSWTERAELAATNSSNGLGISGVTSAISFGGFSPTPSTFAVTSEHWTVDLSNKTITAS